MKNKPNNKYIILAASVLIVLGVAVYLFNSAAGTAAVEGDKEIVIGYFPNLTHGTVMVGLENGYLAEELEGYEIKTQTFPNGSLFMDALTTGNVDIGLVGPGPAMNRYLQGADIVALAGASTGGNLLVTAPDVELNGPEDLAGLRIATPALGCTHDLQLRHMLRETDLSTTRRGGSVDHRTQPPANLSGMFRRDNLDAAVISEPWASRLEIEGEGRVALEWNEVPWAGRLPNTLVVTRKEVSVDSPEMVEKFLAAQTRAIDFINENPDETAEIIQGSIREISGQELDLKVIQSALARTQFGNEIDTASLQEMAEISRESGFISDDNLNGFYGDQL